MDTVEASSNAHHTMDDLVGQQTQPVDFATNAEVKQAQAVAPGMTAVNTSSFPGSRGSKTRSESVN